MDSARTLFKVTEVAQAAGVPRVTLLSWIRKGWVEPQYEAVGVASDSTPLFTQKGRAAAIEFAKSL